MNIYTINYITFFTLNEDGMKIEKAGNIPYCISKFYVGLFWRKFEYNF